jgi:hypothetical protein
MKWALLFMIGIICIAVACKKDVSRVDNSSSGALQSSPIQLLDNIVDTSESSGIDYMDGIYDITVGDDSVAPVYHSDSTTELPCADAITDTIDPGCIFDETDFNGDSVPETPGVNSERLVVDKRTGIIDLDASMQAGIFGPSPANWMRKTFTMYYRLDDGTNGALQRLSIRLIHFKSRSDVPQWLVNAVAVRRQEYRLMTSSSVSLTSLSYTYVYKPKRPPLIVIVSGL